MDRDEKVYNWLNIVRTAVYPQRCILCGNPGHGELDLCTACIGMLPWNSPACSRCGSPLEVAGVVCGPCQRKPPSFIRSHIPFRYEAPLDTLLPELKFRQKLYLAPLLAHLMMESIGQRDEPLPEVLLPVPLHAGRLRERGYNQALEITRPLARQLQISLVQDLCIRERETPAQTSLSGSERRRNLRGAFTVKTGNVPRHVAIVDDVVTTGATVEELARTLRRAGVETVEVWACARAGK